MLRKVIYSLLIIISVFAATLGVAYVYRTEITHSLAEHYLDSYDAQLTCADWHLGQRLFTFEAKELCLTYQGYSLTLQGVALDLDKLHIEKASVVAKPLEKTNQASAQWQGAPLALLLPIKRPLLSIESASITYPGLSRSVQFAITEKRLNHFDIHGDIYGQWHLNDSTIAVDISMAPDFIAVLGQYAKAQNKELERLHADVSQLALNGKFWGNKVAANVTMQSSLALAHDETCIWHMHNGGSIAVQSDNMQQFSLDLSALTIRTELPACAAVNAYSGHLGTLVDQQWQIAFGAPVSADVKGNLAIPSVEFKAQHEAEHAQVQLKDINANWHGAQVKADYEASAALNAYGQLQSQGRFTQDYVKGEFAGALLAPKDVALSADVLHAKGEFLHQRTADTQLHATLRTDEVDVDDLNIEKLSASVNLIMSAQGHLKGDVQTNIAKLNHALFNASGLEQHYDIVAFIGDGRKSGQFEVKSHVARAQVNTLSLADVSITSDVTLNRTVEGSHLVNWQGVQVLAKHNFDKNDAPVSVIINNTPLTAFSPLVMQLKPDVTLIDGTVSFSLQGDAKLARYQYSGEVNNADVLYHNYLAKDWSFAPKGQLSSGTLQLDTTKFTLSELRAGTVLSQIEGYIGLSNSDVFIANVSASVLGGNVQLDKVFLPSASVKASSSFIELDGIDASKLIALEPQQGIKVSGLLGAKLPVTLSVDGVTIDNGKVYSQGAGKLTIDNNAAFDAVKAQQQHLGPMLGMLEDLDIHDMQADVNLAHDGWLNMAMRIKGENLKQKQPVNFNYNHQENIYTLFKALRLSDEITKKVEQEYQSKE
ncbi:intermembrane phospholipid transport protein YdbH family protein [Pseudoalteromonas sp. SSDWG2]|uniref:intermembrane phospholipid transport protein YdbH family protein n=1 Tax=Pseudoalteromonas sp. SSDWG2 TaxID=3139391 RepID=UPI003BA8F9BF